MPLGIRLEVVVLRSPLPDHPADLFPARLTFPYAKEGSVASLFLLTLYKLLFNRLRRQEPEGAMWTGGEEVWGGGRAAAAAS